MFQSFLKYKYSEKSFDDSPSLKDVVCCTNLGDECSVNFKQRYQECVDVVDLKIYTTKPSTLCDFNKEVFWCM